MGLGHLLALCPLVATAPQSTPPNILIVVVDDVGIDLVGSYGVSADVPPTPTLDALAAAGVRFTQAYANPMCSPTRATIQTGRHAFRTGMGDVSDSGRGGFGLPFGEVILPEALDAAASGYAHAAIGKWHLAYALDPIGSWRSAPNDAGYSHFAGALSNFDAGESYSSWMKVVDGVTTPESGYATTVQVDDALAWIDQAQEPWLCYLAFNAAHRPLHEPPAELHTQNLAGLDWYFTPRPFLKAMFQAVDTELGRLLAELGPMAARTSVIVVGDNGTEGVILPPPLDPTQGKQSVYETGVRVPLIYAGPNVASPGTTSDALVHTVDLFSTVLDLAGVDPVAVLPEGHALDGKSLVPLIDGSFGAGTFRDELLVELYEPNGWAPTRTRRALRGPVYKLVRQKDPGTPTIEELYDLVADPFETTDLLLAPLPPAAAAEHARLSALLDRRLAELVEFGYGGAGSGGSVPRLTLSTPVAVGAPLGLRVDSGTGGMLGCLGFSSGQTVTSLFSAPVLIALPVDAAVPHVLRGPSGAAGSGSASFALPAPDPTLTGLTFFAQASYVDPGAPGGLSSTNGLRVVMP